MRQGFESAITQHINNLEGIVGQYSSVVELLRYESIEQANNEARKKYEEITKIPLKA